MEVRFYKFKKSIASTAQVDVSPTATIDVQLKAPTTVQQPVLVISSGLFDVGYTYAYIPDFNRFYFVVGKTLEAKGSGAWIIELDEDLLGTWKTGILTHSCYVTRSASDYSIFIDDNLWSHDESQYTMNTDYSIGLVDLVNNPTGGCIVLAIANDDDAVSPSAEKCGSGTSDTLYICDHTGFGALINALTEDTSSWWSSIDDATTKTLASNFWNPTQYIKSLIYFPFNIEWQSSTGHQWYTYTNPTFKGKDMSDGTNVTLPLGDKTSYQFQCGSGHFGALASGGCSWSRTYGNDSSKDWYDAQNTYNNWTDRDTTWHSSEWYLPSYGMVDFPVKYSGQDMTVTYRVEASTGVSDIRITNGTGTPIVWVQGQMGIDMSLNGFDSSNMAQNMYSVSQAKLASKQANFSAVASGVTAVGQVGMTGLLASMAGNYDVRHPLMTTEGMTKNSGIVSSIQNAQTAQQSLDIARSNLQHSSIEKPLVSVGSCGSMMSVILYPCVKVSHTRFAVRDLVSGQHYPQLISKMGGMCNKVRSLTGLSGFTQCANPNLKLDNAEYGEVLQLNQILESGFYIE